MPTQIFLKNIFHQIRIRNLLLHKLHWLLTKPSEFRNMPGHWNKMKISPKKLFFISLPANRRQTGDKKRFGAYHTAEIGYALHNLDSIQRAWEPVDRRLEKQMSAYWIQFVKTGDPNGPGLPPWGSFSNDNPQSIIFGDSTQYRTFAQ